MTILVLLIALTFALIVTPIVRQLAIQLNFVAIPKKDRAHSIPTPLMGGVALYIGLTGAILIMTLVGAIASVSIEWDNTLPFKEMFIVLGAGTALAVVGLWDDWRPFSPKVKFVLQLIPVVILPLTTSVYVQMRNIPDPLNFVITIVWFMYTINAFNYMDNMDGVAAMTATVAGTFFTVIAVINGQWVIAALASAVAGTSFGFLRYNLFETNKKIFMGDVGSLFLGYLLAVIGLKLTFEADSPWVTWPVPVLVLGLPLFDTAMVFVSRFRRGQGFLVGGTDHLSHRLSRMEFGRFGVPFAIGLLGSALGCVALIIMHSTLINSLTAQVMVGMVALYMFYKFEFAADYEFRTGKPEPEPQPPKSVSTSSQTASESIR
jgi:UDP-GlcNAc:undecaprenyl-phosphate GlcNAc-1-phosphate transferase